ncbi:hypothetical protein H7200_03185 [Candidatus Saccharibacteria bacterium]|nr:hypothetical protein [Candidatus Saccharibacteria bacterium]
MKTKLVIFGITGDLSRRKLLPALHEIVQSGTYTDLSIIGVSRRDGDVKELIKGATGSDLLTQMTTIFTMDLTTASDYVKLKESLAMQPDEQVLIYLSVPPNAAADIVDFLGEAGLNSTQVKLLFEKPFGYDLDSAQDFIARTGRYYQETQLYRIDHYMAKEVAAELIRLRANADSHEHHWGNEMVASIDVIASESIGIEDRAVFYEQTGALRDFIQGHLMQLLSLVLMDVKGPFTIIDVASRRFKALEALKRADPSKAARAQYEGYQQDVENPGSLTETFATVGLESSDERWQGVPIRLTTGKSLDVKRSVVVITYKDGTIDTFEEGAIKTTNEKLPDAYERVLIEAIRGRKYIFTTSPEIIRSWEIMMPIVRSWEMQNDALERYTPGTSVKELISRYI